MSAEPSRGPNFRLRRAPVIADGASGVSHDCPDCRCEQRAQARASFTSRVLRDDGRRSLTGNCWDVEDALDGFFVHTAACPQVGHGWTGGSSCIGLRRWKGPHEDWMTRQATSASGDEQAQR